MIHMHEVSSEIISENFENSYFIYNIYNFIDVRNSNTDKKKLAMRNYIYM